MLQFRYPHKFQCVIIFEPITTIIAEPLFKNGKLKTAIELEQDYFPQKI